MVMMYQAIRPMLGLSDVCIFPISCSQFAAYQLQKRSLFVAIPRIALRLLSCNPLTALMLHLRWKFFLSKKL